MILLVFCGGCAARPPAAPPTIYGYADLGVLVRREPGWRGLGLYDAALARLDRAARLPPAGRPDPRMATLAALPPETAQSAALGTADAGEIARHLSVVQGTLIGSLDDRRKAARADQIRRQQELWRREARRLFPVPARTAEISADLKLQILQTNIEALTQTLSHWKDAPPPAPALDRLQMAVEDDRTQLSRLIAERIQTREAARAARTEALRRLRQARKDYVQTQGDLLTAHLEADDSRIVSAQARRLSVQRRALLEALARPEPASVPAAGDAGTLVLPSRPDAAPPALPAASLQSARTTLSAQRTRWVQYLDADTRASALDTAAQRHWNITFGPPRRGDRDMTADLERALSRG